jgi:hypothetical protein
LQAPVDAQTLSDVRHFAFGRRDFEDALPSLRRWLCARLAGQEADVHDAALLVRPVLQGQRPARDQIAALRQVVGQWLDGD